MCGLDIMGGRALSPRIEAQQHNQMQYFFAVKQSSTSASGVSSDCCCRQGIIKRHTPNHQSSMNYIRCYKWVPLNRARVFPSMISVEAKAWRLAENLNENPDDLLSIDSVLHGRTQDIAVESKSSGSKEAPIGKGFVASLDIERGVHMSYSRLTQVMLFYQPFRL